VLLKERPAKREAFQISLVEEEKIIGVEVFDSWILKLIRKDA
jgi:hypothetical protein